MADAHADDVRGAGCGMTRWSWLTVGLGAIAALCLEVVRRQRERHEMPDLVPRMRSLWRGPVLMNGREHHPHVRPSVASSAKVRRFTDPVRDARESDAASRADEGWR